MDDRRMLEPARLRELLSYDAATGEFRWIKSNSNRALAGSVAGRSTNCDGYKEIQVDKRLYKAHRLAWLFVYGEWPDQIDHINGDRCDNRIENLRNVTGALNTHNQTKPHSTNRSGALGVVRKPNGRFQAEIRVLGRKRCLGTYGSVEAASAAYREAKLRLHEGAI